jgi:DASS family divalent anion:Na+ symporter
MAPSFPSNTARSGVLFPIVLSIAQASDSRPEDGTARKMGSYLMFCGLASIGLSSTLWLTASTANAIGVELARSFGLKITFISWFVAASVPALTAAGLLPLLLYKVFPPGVTSTPEAPRLARQALRDMGPLSRAEKVVAAIFATLVAAWALAGSLHLDPAAIAFAGLGAILTSGALTIEDISREGGVLNTFMWLGILFSLSAQLNEMGFMGFVGQRLAGRLTGLSWPIVYVALVVLYVTIHYFFVNQSSHILALMGVFLDVGIRQGVPPGLMTFALLFASSYFSVLTPQGSGANVVFVGPGYLTQGELYRLGALSVAFNVLVFLAIGTPWIMFVAH